MLIQPSQLTGSRLAAMRQLAGWSQSQLAGRSGVHVQTVKYWEGKQGIIGGYACGRLREVLAGKGITTERVAVLEPEHIAAQEAKRQASLCGAKNRKGVRCQLKPVAGKRRCKFHGGLSTGPKTAEGIKCIRLGQKRRWAAYHGRYECAAV